LAKGYGNFEIHKKEKLFDVSFEEWQFYFRVDLMKNYPARSKARLVLEKLRGAIL
jgi:hypothetical protein